MAKKVEYHAGARLEVEVVAEARDPLGGLELQGIARQVVETPQRVASLGDRKSTRLNSSHSAKSRMPSSA